MGELYFKVDEKTEIDYKTRGSRPFTYTMPGGKTYKMSYWLLPEEIMENRDELPEWVDAAVAASKRAKKLKKKR
jgi:DNA transformation protein